jgi:hypothetical protein
MLAGMGRHRMPKEHRAPWAGLRTLFARSAERDSLFERSFRRCSGCGGDVYVLAEGCRECGRAVPAFA